MRAVTVERYGGLDAMQMSNTLLRPTELGPTEVIVRVYAAAINPVDVSRREGKLKALLHDRFPFIPAEYCLCDETELAHKPDDRYRTHEQAAAMPLAALSALQAFEKARFRQDTIKRVFITAGHGSFGSTAIQIAKGHDKAATAIGADTTITHI
eukprot:3970-Heterococcus_DN1.PRE.3